MLHGTLVKGEQSDEALCSSANSYGPDWYSYEGHHLLPYDHQTLLPGCMTEVTDNCFDVEKHEIRRRTSWFRGKYKRGFADSISGKVVNTSRMLGTLTERILFLVG